jgi:peptide deformylase
MIKSMVYDLIDYDSAILEKELAPFDFVNPPIDPQELALNLLETMRHHKGIGLSANQVGLPYRLFVMEGDPAFACFNPKIVDVSEEVIPLMEGCLSYPGVAAQVKRPAHVRVRFTSPDGNVMTRKFTGMTARIFQHEYDHLQGVSFLKKMHPVHKDKALRQLKKYTRYLKNQQR